MPRYSNNDFLGGSLDYLAANCDKVIVLSDYCTVYATANSTKKVAEAALVSGDFAVTGGDVTGTATAGGASTLTDTTKTFVTNEHTGRVIEITGGTGAGQYRSIASNTDTQVTTSVAWATTPDATSTYKIAAPRKLTISLTGKSAGNALMAVADGTPMCLAFVNTTGSKVLHVTEESTDQPITSGNPVTLNANVVITAGQPTV